MSNQFKRFEKHIPVPVNRTVAIDLLAANCPLSKQQLKTVMVKGAVWVSKGKKTQRLRRAKRELSTQETLHIYYDQQVLEREPSEPDLIADCGQYSVWNKPAGMLSQGSKWGDHCALTRWVEQYFLPARPAFLVHRLDQDANGLIIIAHQSQAAALLSKIFQGRELDKRYRIQVEGAFPQPTEKSLLMTVDKTIDGKRAVSHFFWLDYDVEHNRTLLDVSIETGRKHQIRKHAASQGYPVVGDRLYGKKYQKEPLQLTAYYLAFFCPFMSVLRQFNLLAEIDN